MAIPIAPAAVAPFGKYDSLASNVSSMLLSAGAIPQSSHVYSNYSFIDTLALAQRLQVPFLPITWQGALGAINGGGQAEIYQSLINAQTSLAFKLFRGYERKKNSKLQELISEIVVLTHPVIRQHPYVVRLEGICWDTPQDEPISPVLVFEKAQTGDLYHFLRSGQGQGLSTTDRLDICVDIGIAVRDMHSSGILHGDLKPENVLMFSENSTFVAKVADFGYSTRFCGEDDLVKIPESFPWTAPEWHHREFAVSKAKKMDIYSFGALCLWILFERESFLASYDRDVLNSTPYSSFRDILAERKDDHSFLEVSADALGKDDSLSCELKLRIREFFTLTLANEVGKRSSDFNILLHLLRPERVLPESQTIDLESIPEHENFRIESSFCELYEADFRLRIFIAEELRAMASSSNQALRRIPLREISLQAALCCQLGFGITKDTRSAKTCLEKDHIPESELHDRLALIRDAKLQTSLQKGVVGSLIIDGYITQAGRAQQYRNENILESALEIFKREIESLEDILAPTSPFILKLKAQLAQMLREAGRLKEAEILDLQVLEVSKMVLGSSDLLTQSSMMNLASNYQEQGHLEKAEALKVEILEHLEPTSSSNNLWTLLVLANLASTYRSQGLWKEAERLEIEVVEKRKRLLGESHVDTLASMSNLANTYWKRGRLDEAKQLEMQVVSGAQNLLGTNHPLTLIWIANLASTHHSLGQLKDALDLRTRVSESIETVFGPEHPQTLIFMGDTASLLQEMGRWREAETLTLKVLSTKKKVLGADHPSVIKSAGNLASIYQSQGRYKEAEELELDVIERSARILGKDHPDTLASEGNLASNYRKQNRWKEAEELERRVLETSIAKLGEDHPDTLASMSSLGSVLICQGRYEEAETLLLEVFRLKARSLGPRHPSTLITVGNLALTYLKQGMLNEAEMLERQVLKSRTEVLGKDHPNTRLSRDNLAIILEQQGRPEEAAALMSD